MSRVPWAALSGGEEAEDLIALLLFSEYPVGAQRITPTSKGDGGMDVRIWTPDGWHVYQIKKFHTALTADQHRQVKNSFEAFCREAAANNLPVKCWTLVMPWDATLPQREWFAELTQDAAFPTIWEGFTFLERLAAHHPAAVDYFIGNGLARTQELISRAMDIGVPFTNGPPEGSLVEAAIAKVQDIESLLDKIDPYYRYTFTFEQAPRLADDLVDFVQPPDTAYAKYRAIDSDRCLVIRAFPRTEGTAQLRPIRLHFNLEPLEGTPEAEAVRQFFEYGTSLRDIPGTVIVHDDPTGLVESDKGTTFISFVAQADPELPDLEIRLLDEDGKLLQRVPLVRPTSSAGQVEGGFSLTAEDAGGAFSIVVKGNKTDGRYAMTVTLNNLAGKAPMQVLPGLALLRGITPGRYTVIGVQGAGEVGYRLHVESGNPITQRAADLIEFGKALRIFQHYTTRRIVFPEFEHLTTKFVHDIHAATELLLGKVLSQEWTSITVSAATARKMGATSPSPESALIIENPLTVNLGSYEVALEAREQVILPAPRCSLSAEELRALPADANVELVPGGANSLYYRRLPVEHVPRVIDID